MGEPTESFPEYVAGLAEPEGSVILVPTAYRGRLALAPEALDFVKFCRDQEATVSLPSDLSKQLSADLRGDIWFLPALLVIAQSDVVRDSTLAVAINLFSSYVWDRIKKALPGSKPEVRFRLFQKRGADILAFEYTGSADALAMLNPAHVAASLRSLDPEIDDADVESLVGLSRPRLPENTRGGAPQDDDEPDAKAAEVDEGEPTQESSQKSKKRKKRNKRKKKRRTRE
ncbi:MAG: hypothetical protein RLO52_20950 [Sandaracinaceae bacterium]